ncbi:transglycosylase domain-containing protein [Mucilaginibacter antarcticus]|uniref:transglycosylase domain-containing protein n=1 Tax=Mucilaginibacter antarcticus TaxID=1855725 RepID=UPI00363E1A3C
MKGLGKLIWRFVKLFVIFFVGVTVFWVIFYRFINPPVTWLMLTRGFEQKADSKPWKIDKDWRDFDDIADQMKRAAVAAEDATFLENHGFDFHAIEKAIQKNSRSRKLIGAALYRSRQLKTFSCGPAGRGFAKGLKLTLLYS